MNNQMPIAQIRATRWCGTWNNYTDEDERIMQTFINTWCAYGIYGREEAPSTGTKHLQFYFRLHKQARGSFLKAHLPTAHIEPCKGSEIDNVNYCSKAGENNTWSSGELMKGAKSALEKQQKTRNIIKDYMTLPYMEFREKHPWEALHYKMKLEQWRIDSLVCKEPWGGDLKSKNFWIWGAPGTGKSRWARSQADPRTIYLKGVNKWWSGYIEGLHKLILFEDWPKDAKFMGGLMKVWADRYTFTAETKGGTLFVDPRNWALVVTSNYSMDECFDPVDVEALERRFTVLNVKSQDEIIQFTKINFE